MTQHAYRRLYGTTLGIALGLTFGLTSQVLNALAVPGVIFHQPPLGMSANILSCALIGGLLGLVSGWLSNSFSSVMIAAVLSGIGLELFGTFYGTSGAPPKVGITLFMLLVLLLPMTGLLGAIFGLQRWIVNKQVDQWREHAPLLHRILLPMATLLIVGAIGATALYPAEGQQRIKEMNALIQAGLQAGDAASVPPAFAKFADTFKPRATPTYTLQWIKGDLIRWRIGQPVGYQEWQLSIAVARFDNGWVVACLFSPSEGPPNCKAYDRDPSVNYPDSLN